MQKFISHSVAETSSWAKNLAKSLHGGEVFSLEGNLGAGKTVVSKAIAAALGVNEVVNSPTFVLMKVYAVGKHRTIKNLVHVDAYRLSNGEELLNIGLADYMGRPDTVVLVEWGDKVREILPSRCQKVLLSQPSEKERIIQF